MCMIDSVVATQYIWAPNGEKIFDAHVGRVGVIEDLY